MMLGDLAGVRVFADSAMLDQFRVPRSKRSRIRAKWAKKPANFRPSRNMLVDELRGYVYCHPVVYEEIKRQFPPPTVHITGAWNNW